METLRKYLNGLSQADQRAFATNCETSVGYLRKAICVKQRLEGRLAVAIDRESKGAVRCEDLRPDIDWKYVRRSKAHGRARSAA